MIDNLQPVFASINPVVAINRALANRPFEIKRPRLPPLIRRRSNEEKLIDATASAHEVLFSANTVFPFVLFPSTISVDRQQLTISHRSFFRTANTISVRIGDILNVESSVGPFFGSVHLFSKFFTNDLKSISFLKRSDALSMQRLIQGYTIAHLRGIDCANIEKAQLVTLLDSLGQGAGLGKS